jgi:transcriptional regulator with XRE-family HTH domain
MDIKERFGKQVRKHRIQRGLSQEALSMLTNLDRTYIPSIEKGERNVSIGVAERIAKALEVDIGTLLSEEH